MNSEEIILLSEDISTKIAAGEIIERPVNVVKELIENALDADADDITVEIIRGGKGLIRVSDNGKGIQPNDLKKSVLRFATSKISTLEDLSNINTFGFRGEALAAISSVSDFSIKSGRDGFDTYELRVNFGEIESFNMVSPYRGTIVSVENIFMQLPGRYKFLKSNASEAREITKLMKQFIILNDNVTFQYFIDGKKIFHFKKGYDTLSRAKELMGEENLKSIAYDDDTYKIKAIISDPSIQKNRADDIIIYVNGRIVKDAIILKAIMQGYAYALPHNKYPLVIIDIDVLGNFIDVNVHPAKNTVKWLSSSEIFQRVHKLISENISGGFSETLKDFDMGNDRFSISDKNYNSYKILYNNLEMPDDLYKKEHAISIKNDFNILGQLFNTIIVVEKDNKVYFIDQHIAHERILFEKFSNGNKLENNFSSYLNEPIIFDFDDEKIDLLEKIVEEFMRLGFEYERFGKNAIKLVKVPSYLLRNDVATIFETTVNDLDGLTDETFYLKIITQLSCKAAVKANELLTAFEMENLIRDLFKTANPYTCPHGRRIIYELSKEDLYKKFNRI